jgi:acyl-ACP thioesterase
MRTRELAWILSRMRIDFHTMPGMGERVSLRTWHKGVQQRLFFTRDFVLRSEKGPVAEASFCWILVDWVKRRMLPPAALPGELVLHAEDAIPDLLEKIVVPDGLPVVGSFEVGYSAVDPVGHANSGRYVEWLEDCIPYETWQGRRLTRLQVNFSTEVKPGGHVTVTAGEAGGRWLAQGTILESGIRAFEAELGWQPDT